MLGFVAAVFVVIVLIHLYLWKRLVKDTLRPGRKRQVAGVAFLILAALVPVTLIGVRSGTVKWLAWPGYMWLALMFYLLVALVVLEIPRLAIRLWWRRQSPAPAAPAAKPSDTQPPDSQPSDPPPPGTLPSGAPPPDTLPSATPPSATPSFAASALPSPAPRRADLGDSAPAKATNGTAEGHKVQDRATALAAEAATTPAVTGKGVTAQQSAPIHPAEPSSNPTGPNHDRDAEGSPSRNATSTQGDAERPPSDPENLRSDPENLRSDSETPRSDPGNPQNHAGNPNPRGIDRRLLLSRGAAIFAGLTAAAITGYGVRTALGTPQVNRVQIPLAKLPRSADGLKLAVVSDIHLGPLTGTRHAARIVEVINSVDADVVCVVGDLVDGSVAELGRFAEPLAGIRARQGAYFVTGNHEYYSGFAEWVAEVDRLGVRPLRNQRLELDGIDLAGVNDVGGAEFGDAADYAKALGDRDPARPVVLMAHQPRAIHEAAPYGVDLQVSGHTHGGQMAPFNLFVPLQQPVTSGLGTVDGVPVFVTNGAGFWGPPVRVGAPPQVSLIELRTR